MLPSCLFARSAAECLTVRGWKASCLSRRNDGSTECARAPARLTLLCLDEDQQRAIGRGWCDANSACAADAGAADLLPGGGEIGCRKHEARSAALWQSRQRDFRISPAELVFREKHEIGAIRT